MSEINLVGPDWETAPAPPVLTPSAARALLRLLRNAARKLDTSLGTRYLGYVEVFITDDARKHEISDERILHAHDHLIKVKELDEGFTMGVGADEAGRLLEVGWIVSDDAIVIIHADEFRPHKFR